MWMVSFETFIVPIAAEFGSKAGGIASTKISQP